MNVFMKLLSGRVYLPLTFWLFGVPGYIAALLAQLFALNSEDLMRSPAVFWSVGYLLALVHAFLLLIAIAIWRSATKYQGSIGWACGAKVYAIYIGLTSLYILLPVAVYLATLHSMWATRISN